MATIGKARGKRLPRLRGNHSRGVHHDKFLGSKREQTPLRVMMKMVLGGFQRLARGVVAFRALAAVAGAGRAGKGAGKAIVRVSVHLASIGS